MVLTFRLLYKNEWMCNFGEIFLNLQELPMNFSCKPEPPPSPLFDEAMGCRWIWAIRGRSLGYLRVSKRFLTEKLTLIQLYHKNEGMLVGTKIKKEN